MSAVRPTLSVDRITPAQQQAMRPVAQVGLIELRCACNTLLCRMGQLSTVSIVCPRCKTHVFAYGSLTPVP